MRWLTRIQRFHAFCRASGNQISRCSSSVNPDDATKVCTDLMREFHNVGIEDTESRSSAEHIIAHVLGKKMFHQVPRGQTISETQLAKIRALATKRMERMPLQYVIQEWDFHEFTVKLSPPVLIPRPETEELVEYVVQHVGQDKSCQTFLEVGCGSGAVTLYLLSKLPWMTAVACDISRVACDITLENLTKHHAQGRAVVLNMDFKRSETLQYISQLGPFDIIISNPPYIPTADIDSLDPEVRRYEDRGALDGGADGLDFVRHLLAVSPMLLKKRGKLWLETGLEQHKAIQNIINSDSSCSLEFVKSFEDFTRRERFCLIQRH